MGFNSGFKGLMKVGQKVQRSKMGHRYTHTQMQQLTFFL